MYFLNMRSSSSCCWHRVQPVASSTSPQRTLILRSNCMTWRHSGGMANSDGERTNGWPNATKAAFADFAAIVAGAISRHELSFSFNSDLEDSVFSPQSSLRKKNKWICMYTHVYIYVYMYVWVCICLYVYAYVYICMTVYVFACVSMYIHVGQTK